MTISNVNIQCHMIGEPELHPPIQTVSNGLCQPDLQQGCIKIAVGLTAAPGMGSEFQRQCSAEEKPMRAVPAPRAPHVGGASRTPQGRIMTAEEFTSDPDLIPLYRSLKATQ